MILNCQHCQGEVERTHARSVVTCFTCKMASIRLVAREVSKKKPRKTNKRYAKTV